jgi:hypothetical protein
MADLTCGDSYSGDPQGVTSRNVRGGRFVDLLLGGLNYQIEHHLFPSMPRPNLRRAQPLIAWFCAERGIRYAETGLLTSVRMVLGHLNEVAAGTVRPADSKACVAPTSSRCRHVDEARRSGSDPTRAWCLPSVPLCPFHLGLFPLRLRLCPHHFGELPIGAGRGPVPSRFRPVGSGRRAITGGLQSLAVGICPV